jgi:hypothetical protein
MRPLLYIEGSNITFSFSYFTETVIGELFELFEPWKIDSTCRDLGH